MPKQNRGGPLGMGPKTGRGLGLCAKARKGTFTGDERCRGLGRGFGRCRNGDIDIMPNNLDLLQRDQLEKQKEFLQTELASVSAQLEKL